MLLLTLFVGLVAALGYEDANSLWNYTHVGRPVSGIVGIETSMLLSQEGILSMLNANGDPLWRYKHWKETNFNSSSLIKWGDFGAVSLFGSTITVWGALDSAVPELIYQYTANDPIVHIQIIHDIIYVIDNNKISVLNSEFQFEVLKTFNETLIAASLHTSLTGETVLLTQYDGAPVTISKLDSESSSEFLGCSLNDLKVEPGLDLVLICPQSAYILDTDTLQSTETDVPLLYQDFQDYKYLQFVDGYHVTVKEEHIIILDSAGSALYEFVYPHSLSLAPFHVWSINDSHAHLLLMNGEDVIEYYVDGHMRWYFDQSFAYPVDAVTISSSYDEEQYHLFVKNYEYYSDPSVGILTRWFRRSHYNLQQLMTLLSGLRHPWTLMFSKYSSEQLGFEQKLIILAENGKVGVFDLVKHDDGSSQLISILDVPYKIKKLHNINGKLFVYTNSHEFAQVDIETGILLHVDQTEFPLMPDAPQLINAESAYTMQYNDTTQGLQGFYLKKTSSVQTWFKSFSNEQYMFSLKRAYGNDHVYTSMIHGLYKYLMPNMRVILSHDKLNLNIRLVSVVTGQVAGHWIKPITNIDTSKIKAIFEENYIIITIPQLNSTQNEAVVIDLYESLEKGKTTMPRKVSHLSGDLVPPQFAMQSYIIPNVVQLAQVETVGNMAEKTIAFALGDIDTGYHICLIAKALLDGLRNSKAKENNLIPYDPVINLMPHFQLTQNLHLLPHNLKLISSTTNLESTSYLIGIGGDIVVGLAGWGRFDVWYGWGWLIVVLLLWLLGRKSNSIQWIL
ncbi:Emc1 protein [Martiniozyma asiatica (nom. inval.)]|nr:Emc1 protein [Martiniozyma asiatica]